MLFQAENGSVRIFDYLNPSEQRRGKKGVGIVADEAFSIFVKDRLGTNVCITGRDQDIDLAGGLILSPGERIRPIIFFTKPGESATLTIVENKTALQEVKIVNLAGE